VEARREEIEAYRARNPKNHFEVLGISLDGDASAVRGAFFQLARVWHPDRLPAELSELKSFVTKTFAAMGEAHQLLSDDARRAEYRRALSNVPDDEQAQVAAILDAASAFQRAEILMNRKDFAQAMQEAKRAYDLDPTQADYAALYAWIQGMNRTSGFEDLIALLDSALSQNAENVRALWYRGQLLKKAGQHLRAQKDFKSIVALKPGHVEAQREIRVHAMRKKSGGDGTQPPPPSGGLFGVFKKKT
jgi:curved DNA-binding protein CbpA